MHGDEAPSAWVRRWSHLVPAGARLLDVACGRGRHVRWFAARGVQVTALDRDAEALQACDGASRRLCADIEGGPWPLAGERFDAVLVTHYLWRLRMPDIVGAVADGGVLVWETFAAGHEAFGKPSRPDFLLRPGELLQAAAGLQVVAYEDGELAGPPRRVQRIVARRGGAAGSAAALNPG